MRHRKKGRKLNRTAAHRKATMKQLGSNLIRDERLITTVAKAKELRPFIEKIVTRAGEDTVHNRRQAKKKLNSDPAVKKLFEEIGPRFVERSGGYTRILKLDERKGDGTTRALIEFVE